MSLGTDVRSLWGAGATCDLDPTFGVIIGVLAVAHAVARRFVTPNGSLGWDGDAGHDIRDYLNDDLDTSQLSAIAARVRLEALKDERVETAKAQASLTNGVLLITLACTTGEGPFELVLAASKLTVDLLSIR